MTLPPVPQRDPRSTPKAGDTLLNPDTGERWHVVGITGRTDKRRGKTRKVSYLSSYQRAPKERVMDLDQWQQEVEAWDALEVAK